MANIQDQITTHLLQTKSLSVSPTWLRSFLSTISAAQRNTPIPALTQTALFRLLTSDIRESLTSSPSTTLPVDISDTNVRERRLTGTIPVQVLDIEDIGTSAWSQVEAIERVERGEAVRGREIVRTVNVGDEDQDELATTANANASNGPHRLILQDAKGARVMGIEMKKITGLAFGKMAIGAKLLLRGVVVARGMILLTPDSVTLLGGKVEAMDQAWRAGRKERLLQKVTEAGTDTGRA
jgi:RecQ-mediated genome instability protein 1